MKRIFIPALFAMFLAAPAAYASHYDLADIDIVPAETVDTLAKNKVETTKTIPIATPPKRGVGFLC